MPAASSRTDANAEALGAGGGGRKPGVPGKIQQRRTQIAEHEASLARRYWAREAIEGILADRTAYFDQLLQEIWRQCFGAKAKDGPTLFALGGYARGELHPGSDLDLLILAEDPHRHRGEIEPFVRSLFDLNLAVGHSVRTLGDCRRAALRDLSAATALFERRLLIEPASPRAAALAGKLDKAMTNPRLWPPDAFFRAKRDEQEQRHRHFANVDYDLEPDIKTSPGGLRDLQTALWVSERKFGTRDPQELRRLGVLTQEECDWLANGRRYLRWVRYGLHLVAGRKEDRLQFQHQRALAQRLGYVDTAARLGVERFMHQYYRYVLSLREVNDIVFQFLEESLAKGKIRVEPINERFRIAGNQIEAVHDQVFARKPGALLEMFVLLAHRRDVSGVRAATIRLIREHVHLIDEQFRNDPENSRLFLELLKAPHTLVTQLTRMRRYGILPRYIPEFGAVVGQMQHDLFHVYTVDAHTMMVIRQMRRFRYRAQAETYPLAHHCVKSIPKVELLYIAGLFHDIGKGRGGDHSILGARDAVRFCRRHGLSDDDTELVEWLVANHLAMSGTVQRKDIYDPEVVLEFARFVRSERRLDYLYALTVADITATNPSLWNSWRATLLGQLYCEARKLLRRGLESPADKRATARACRESALEELAALGLSPQQVQPVWTLLGDEFLLRHRPRQVAEIVAALKDHDPDASPLVLMKNTESQAPGEGATEIFLYTRDKPNLFAASVIAIDRLRLSIYDANIRTAPDGRCFNTYVVLDENRQPVRGDRASLVRRLVQAVAAPRVGAIALKRLPRRHKQLSRPTEARLATDAGAAFSTLRVLTADRPGLLARIGLLFHQWEVSVLGARIATLGERVEDAFYLQTASGGPIDDPQFAYGLENALRQALDAEGKPRRGSKERLSGKDGSPRRTSQ